jgi:DnaK suppressor protein
LSEDLNLESYKKRLLERLSEIERSEESTKEDKSPVELDQARFGRLSRMDAMQQQAMSQASGRMLQQEKLRIKAALKRIDSEDFGYCLKCDEQIAKKRLDFDPSVPLCIECASAAEKR